MKTRRNNREKVSWYDFHARMRWMKQYRNCIDGALCVAASLFLVVSLAFLGNDAISNYCLVSGLVVVIALYALVRGVFTLAFGLKENDLGLSVYQHIRVELYNQLFYVYEKMLWLWMMLPLLIVASTFVFSKYLEGIKWIYVVIGIVYVVLLAVFSKTLIRKRRHLRKRIKEIENDLVETNASS